MDTTTTQASAPSTDTGSSTTPAATTKRAKTARKVAKKAVKAASKPPSDGRIALKTICGQLRMEPKAARRKLRAAKLAFHSHNDRWTFTAAQADRVRSILRPDRKPAAAKPSAPAASAGAAATA